MPVQYPFAQPDTGPDQAVATNNQIQAQVAAQLGVGLKIPLNCVNGTWDVASGLDKVNQDIFVVLATPVGSRLGQPDFGSTIYMLLFEAITPSFFKALQQAVNKAIEAWLGALLTLTAIRVDMSQVSSQTVPFSLDYQINGVPGTQNLPLVLAMGDGLKFVPADFTVNGHSLV